MTKTRPGWPALLLLTLGACASYPAPTERLANTAASIRGAQEVGATGTPQAALHLKFAQDGLARAKALAEDGKNEKAEQAATMAQADAELALALTREAAAAQKAAQPDGKARTNTKSQPATEKSP